MGADPSAVAQPVGWWWWIALTLVAAAAQTARNAMQKGLTASLGTVGATLVRFVFGLPFAALSLLAVTFATGIALPRISGGFLLWVALGALTQIAATALMLAAMRQRSFVAATAYVKTEALQVAVFGLIFLSERLSPLAVVAIITA
ncbi:MAG TPA: EamA/RhaT family transporter, partial [Lautropia sp.]|nr:EamA/RhaT family transporter [Lautropia sp.]